MVFSSRFRTSIISVAALVAVVVAVAFPSPAYNRRDYVPRAMYENLELGAQCTNDLQCLSGKCFPSNFTEGGLVCTGSPAGYACETGSTCISCGWRSSTFLNFELPIFAVSAKLKPVPAFQDIS